MRSVAYRATVAVAAMLPSMGLANAAETESAGILEEVTVTAQKRETRLEDTPVAVSAFAPDFIDRNRIPGCRSRLDGSAAHRQRSWRGHYSLQSTCRRIGSAGHLAPLGLKGRFVPTTAECLREGHTLYESGLLDLQRCFLVG